MYYMKFFVLGLTLALLYASSNLASSQGTFSVSTDKQTYILGETVIIRGTVPVTIVGKFVAIQVFNPMNTIYIIDQSEPDSNGNFSTQIKLGGKLAINGLYTVRATYFENTVTTSFELVTETKPSIQNIKVESELKDKVFDVLVSFSNGRISSIDVEPDFNSVLILTETDVAQNGTLQITLPRDLIDAREGPEWTGADKPFQVLVDDKESMFMETNSTSTARTLEIGIPAGTEKVEIVGTVTVPEFPITLLILAASIAGIIIGARFSINKLLN